MTRINLKLKFTSRSQTNPVSGRVRRVVIVFSIILLTLRRRRVAGCCESVRRYPTRFREISRDLCGSHRLYTAPIMEPLRAVAGDCVGAAWNVRALRPHPPPITGRN